MIKCIIFHLKVCGKLEEVVEHDFGANPLPIEHAVQRLAVRNVDRDHREVGKGRNSGEQGRKIEGRLNNNDGGAPLLFLVAGKKFVEGLVHLLDVDLNSNFEGVVCNKEFTL